MEYKDPMMRLVIFGKIKKMMKKYQNNQINDLDRRLLRGLFLKKMRDFDEEQREKANSQSLMSRLSQVEDFFEEDLLGTDPPEMEKS